MMKTGENLKTFSNPWQDQGTVTRGNVLSPGIWIPAAL